MYISDIIPLINLPLNTPQILSYYSTEELPSGALVEVLLGKQKINGVIYKTVNLKQRKALIKKSDFTVKKIQKIIYPRRLVSNYLISLATFISQYYFSPLSLSLKIILPKNINNFIAHLNKFDPNFIASNSQLDLINDSLATEIITSEKQLIHNLANSTNEQILILVPTNFHEIYLLDLLKKHRVNQVQQYKRNNKEIATLWHNLNQQKNNIIIGNRSAIFLPFNNINKIIIINPDNVSYKSFNQKPYYYTLDIAKKISLYYHATLFYYYHY